MLALLVNVIRVNGPSLVRVHPEDWYEVEGELATSDDVVWPVLLDARPLREWTSDWPARILGVPVRLDPLVNRGCVAWEGK